MKKKICFLTDSIFSVGGVQRVTAVVAKALAKDCDVTIVTFDPPASKDTSLYGLDGWPIAYRFVSYPSVGWLPEKLCKAYSACYKLLQPRWRWASDLYARSSFPAPRRRALEQELNAGHYDAIVGVHAPLAARLATMKPRLRGARCIGWVHNSFEALFGPTSLYIGPRLKHHYLCQFQKLDSTVVLSRFDARCYQAAIGHCSTDNGQWPTVIYNPLTLQPGAPSRGTSRQFLAVGRFSHRHKGFDLLIDAFRLFARQDKEWTLHIVGEGPEEPLYRQKIADYGLEQRIMLHPFTNHIQDYYTQAQVYVLSSRWEGFGLVLVEAMAHGLPVVSSNLPTSLEIMGDYGLYFENGNVEQLALRLVDATQLDWKAKSERALEVARRFDVDHIISQWKEELIPDEFPRR